MKKVFGILFIAIFAIGMTSCKKDYTCECTLTGTTIEPLEITKAKKADAETVCDAREVAYSPAVCILK